ncbi:hemicentin-2, partial [Drosophila albomicans]|uniref:Hemicentin-2 n=2 Tax=nasuta subgroup TaxID=32307 RepID=A0A6P8WF64_DROAB
TPLLKGNSAFIQKAINPNKQATQQQQQQQQLEKEQLQHSTAAAATSSERYASHGIDVPLSAPVVVVVEDASHNNKSRGSRNRPAPSAKGVEVASTRKQRGLPQMLLPRLLRQRLLHVPLHLMELRILLLCLPTLLLATTLEPDQKSILTDNDWKKLWMRGGINADSKLDNNLDSSDSPMFEDSELMAHNTTVQLGGTAFLVCKVSGVDRNQISWIRRRDWHILSSGAQLYTNDERFAILHTPGSNMWTLQIKFVQRRDHGMYECQVSTPTGIISHFVNLQVVVPEAFILGSGELHVDMGSTINLVCIIEKSPTPPQYVYWQKNDRLINYYDSRRDISIETTPGPRTQSRLIIREPQITDSGNYTCSASNTEPASIYVFVSKGDNMAAISRRKTSSADRITHIFRSMLAPCLLLNTVVVRRIFLT